MSPSLWESKGAGLEQEVTSQEPRYELCNSNPKLCRQVCICSLFRTRSLLHPTLPGVSSNLCSSCAPHFGSPGGAAINVRVLGVGVIYNPLHVRHSAPQARKINNRKLQQAVSEGSSTEIRVAAPSRLTIDFIWSTYTSHHAINLQQRFTNACSPTKGPTVPGLPPTSCVDLQLLLHWFPYLSQAAALLYKSRHSAAYSKEQSDGGSTPSVMWPINAPHLWFCAPHGDVCVHYLLWIKLLGHKITWVMAGSWRNTRKEGDKVCLHLETDAHSGKKWWKSSWNN